MRDYHVHTHFSDGKCSPREMVEAALAMGMDVLGFSDHGYTDFDGTYCMSAEEQMRYVREIRELAEEYQGNIRILCGIEQDLFAGMRPEGFDYAIGSVHYFRFGDRYVDVDHTAQILLDAADEFCGGDIYRMAEIYYENVSRVVEVTNCDIIGHFDLITKHNEKFAFMDENHPRYVAAWKKAADCLLSTNRPFEINMGAISRGYKSKPYPADPILTYLRDRGAQFILNSDSHHKDNLCYQFDRWGRMAKDLGLTMTDLHVNA